MASQGSGNLNGYENPSTEVKQARRKPHNESSRNSKAKKAKYNKSAKVMEDYLIELADKQMSMLEAITDKNEEARSKDLDKVLAGFNRVLSQQLACFDRVLSQQLACFDRVVSHQLECFDKVVGLATEHGDERTAETMQMRKQMTNLNQTIFNAMNHGNNAEEEEEPWFLGKQSGNDEEEESSVEESTAAEESTTIDEYEEESTLTDVDNVLTCEDFTDDGQFDKQIAILVEENDKDLEFMSKQLGTIVALATKHSEERISKFNVIQNHMANQNQTILKAMNHDNGGEEEEKQWFLGKQSSKAEEEKSTVEESTTDENEEESAADDADKVLTHEDFTTTYEQFDKQIAILVAENDKDLDFMDKRFDKLVALATKQMEARNKALEATQKQMTDQSTDLVNAMNKRHHQDAPTPVSAAKKARHDESSKNSKAKKKASMEAEPRDELMADQVTTMEKMYDKHVDQGAKDLEEALQTLNKTITALQTINKTVTAIHAQSTDGRVKALAVVGKLMETHHNNQTIKSMKKEN